jgi:DNA-binding beta-propeller fold protein YncE
MTPVARIRLLVACSALLLGAARSGPIALSPDERVLWVVNPDADSVTRLDVATLRADLPRPVGREPWSVAVARDGRVVVANRAGGTLTVLEAGERREIPVGAEPAGVVLAADERHAYVTLASEARVVQVELASGRLVASAAVGPAPEALATAGDRVVVAHLRARAAGDPPEREGWLTLLPADLAAPRDVVLPPYEFGFANLVGGLAVHGERAWVTHALNAPAPPMTFNTTVSAALSSVALTPGRTDTALHLNDPTFSTPVNAPRAVAVTADGATAYVVLSGSDQLMGLDVRDPAAPVLLGFWPTGANPRGVVLSADGRRAFVMNHLSRDVSVLDLSDARNRRPGTRVRVAPETLSPSMWLGKRLFHHAADPRMSTLGWMACASCHVEGGADGTTWPTPEGKRQTMPLWALASTGPPLHASATRDEAQDFQEDIERLLRGGGLVEGRAHRLLGEPNAGRSAALDALAEFVLHGFRVPVAPPAGPGAARGRVVFAQAGCPACHGGPGWTRNALPAPPGTLAPGGEVEVEAVLRDVGTHRPENGPLGARGFKVPTLLGLHASAPYLHDGSAPDLHAVLANPRHAGRLDAADADDLVAFLLAIDAGTPPFE